MRDLEHREKKMNDVQATGDKLLRDGHPAKKTVEVRRFRMEKESPLHTISKCRSLK